MRGSSGSPVMPAALARLLSTQIVGLVVLNALIGLAIPVIDNAAHAVGFVTGLALGWTAAGAVSARLASIGPPGRAERAPRESSIDHDGWCQSAVAVVVVLSLNAMFPRLPSAPARIAILDAGCGLHSGSACLAAAREVQARRRARSTPGARGYLDRGCRPAAVQPARRLRSCALQAGSATGRGRDVRTCLRER